MASVIKKILIAVVMLVLLMPAIQYESGLFLVKKLDGYFEPVVDTSVTMKGWFDKTYQDQKEKYLDQNFGFHNFSVRLYNQYQFSLFSRINVKDVFRGKNNFLYSYKFYESYAGINFRGEIYADSIANRIAVLKSELEKKNIKLLICIAPCKESFFPEYLPDSCAGNMKTESYYSYYEKRFRQDNIPLLDYHRYFQSLKKVSEYPLFTQGAVHWTTYGAALAADTLFRRISGETGRKMYEMRINSVELSRKVMGSDNDITRAMNLMFDVNTEPLAYPSYEIADREDSCFRPKVMIIGDSFYYGPNNTWLPLRVFSPDSWFLYYFKEAMPYREGKTASWVRDMDLRTELKNTDIIVLFFTIGNLNFFPYQADSLVSFLNW
jgi:hypothetical protein